MASRRKKMVREWFRRSVLKRDGHKCRKCGSEELLAAHHITDRSKMPNGGYVLDNGITLCPDCHVEAEKFHQSEGKEWVQGWHPKDMYALIGSNYENAYYSSKRMDDYNPYPRKDPYEYGK